MAGAIEAQTGIDLAAPWRGRYHSFAAGRRLLRRAGYADHVALVADHLAPGHASTAQVGDIAIIPTETGPAGGVVQGAGVYALGLDGNPRLVPLHPSLAVFCLEAC